MGISVIIVGYYGDDWLPACIQSLAMATEEKLHVVLVDNAGNEILDQIPHEKFQWEIIQTPRPLGFAEANNYALIKAKELGDIVVFLNQDTISTSGWLTECVDVLKADSTIGAVTPVVRTYDDDGWDAGFLAGLQKSQRVILERRPETRLLDVDAVQAAALLVRRTVLMRTGPFDPIFGSYYEDYDLCRRIRAEGFRVVISCRARIRHFSGSATRNRSRERARMRQIVRNRAIYRVRGANSRTRTLLSLFAFDFPHRILRGALRRPAAQPIPVTVGAYRDLLRIARRIASPVRDTRLWCEYLEEIDWRDFAREDLREE